MNAQSHTPWNSAEIWMRTTFEWSQTEPPELTLWVYHDEDISVYLNGVLALHRVGHVTEYQPFELPIEVRSDQARPQLDRGALPANGRCAVCGRRLGPARRRPECGQAPRPLARWTAPRPALIQSPKHHERYSRTSSSERIPRHVVAHGGAGGLYVSDRQWGTVREDYGPDGDSWRYFPFDHAHERAYRWGEDGIAGWCDLQCRLCLALAFWNGRDPCLKERYFGLANGEGNHGEDVKDLYYHLDATPTHSYMKMLYKYPQDEFPYQRLRDENRNRGKDQTEFELLDTGIFDANRYFDIFVEYAKASPNDTLLEVTVENRGPDPAVLHFLPQFWFRNTWSWHRSHRERPEITPAGSSVLQARHHGLGEYFLHTELEGELLFCDNETNAHRLFGTEPVDGYWKSAFHDYVVRGDHAAVNPRRRGTKAAFVHVLDVPAGGRSVARLRLSDQKHELPFESFDNIVRARRAEADEFYQSVQEDLSDPDVIRVQRQALAGMVWNKQYYHYDVPQWLEGDPRSSRRRRKCAQAAGTVNGPT